MAGLPEGFQEDTIQGFLRHISYNVPNFTEHQLDLLVDYMKEVGATSEEELYKMNEEHLADLLGEEEAKLIMRYCKATMEMGARKRSVNGEQGAHGGKEQGEELPSGASSSSFTHEPPRNEKQDEMSTMFQMFLSVYQSESKQNRDVLERIGKTIETVTTSMKETVTTVSDMMNKQLEKQDEVLKMLNRQAVGMEERQQRSLDQTRQWMEGMRDMNNQSVLTLGEKVDKAMKMNEATNKKLSELLAKKKKSCVIQ